MISHFFTRSLFFIRTTVTGAVFCGVCFFCTAAVDQFFNQHFFNIDVKTEHADERKGLEKFLILCGSIRKGFLSFVIFAYDVLLHYFNFFPLETKHLVIDRFKLQPFVSGKETVGNRF